MSSVTVLIYFQVRSVNGLLTGYYAIESTSQCKDNHYIVLVKVDLSIQCSKRVGDSPLSTFKTSLRAEINIETAIWE
jgi:hypothetical protein